MPTENVCVFIIFQERVASHDPKAREVSYPQAITL